MQNTKYNSYDTRTNQNKRSETFFSTFINLLFIIILSVYIVFNGGNILKLDNNNGVEENVNVVVSANAEVHDEQPEIVSEESLNNALPLEIHEFAVSCANAQMIRYNGITIFIDGGASFTYEKMTKQMETLGVRSIDYYLATHWHTDHISNMRNILTEYGHERTVVYGPSITSNDSSRVTKGTYKQLIVGDQINIGNLKITCVGPYEVKEGGNSNPDSLNIVIQYGSFRAMITGDYVYDRAIEDYPELTRNLDVMQMPHHGLKNFSISRVAMKHCNPKTVLVPAEKSDATLGLVSELDINAEVLDNKDGHICVISYGEGYRVFTNVTSIYDLY